MCDSFVVVVLLSVFEKSFLVHPAYILVILFLFMTQLSVQVHKLWIACCNRTEFECFFLDEVFCIYIGV